MSHVHLILGTNSMRLKGLIHPGKDQLDLGFAMGVSGGGDVHVSRKCVPSLTLVRSFAQVRDRDYGVLKDWYVSVSEGPRNPFVFIDYDGGSHTVRWMNGLADWQRDAENHWSGFLELRVEGFEP